MTTVQIKGKTLTAVEIEPTIVGTSQQYAQQAKQYRDEAEVFATMAGNYVSNFNDTVETSKTEISNTADMAISEVQETVDEAQKTLDEAQKTLETKNNELLNEVKNISIRIYDKDVTYKKGDWVTGIVDDKKKIYESVIDNNKGASLTDSNYWNEIELGGGSSSIIGEIISVACGSDYVPDGCLPCDGAEYSKTQFPSLWENYLTSETYSLNTGLDHSGGKIQTDGTIKPWLLTVKGDSISDEVVFCLNLSEDVQTKQYITGDSGIYIENGKVYYSADEFLINVSANGKLYIKATISENTPSEDYPYAYKISYAYSNDNSIYVDSTFPLAYAESFEILLSNPNYPVDLTKSYLNSTPLAVPKTLLNTCNYEDYATEIETYGQCSRFAVDVGNETFRVPLIKDTETVITNNIDYASKLTLTSAPVEATPFVAPYDGVLIFCEYQNINEWVYCYINGVQSPHQYNDGDNTVTPETYYIPLSKGDSIYWSQNLALRDGGFYPYKEETKEKLKTFVVVANGQINESMMDWSAWASGLQSKLNKDHSNDEKPYITEVSDRSLLPSWYRIWSDGWCEQGGLATGGTSTSGAPVIFLKPFVQDDFLLSSNIISESSKLTNLATRYVNQFNVTREGFSAITGYNASSSTGSAYEFTWQAKGYIK